MIYKRMAARLKGQDWLAITIELAIVVVGVFVGTQVSNWNAARLDRAETQRMLAQLPPELKSQIDFFDSAKAYYATTRRFAATAFSGWRNDPRVSDNDFVIAAYQASQIQGVGVNSDTWANIFGAGRLSSIDNPAIRRDLSLLMYSDNTSIGINAVDTPYRRNVRRIIPIDTQDKIRVKCGDYTPVDRINVVLLPDSCDLKLAPDEAATAAAALRAHPELVDDLQWHTAAAVAFLTNMQIFDTTTHKLLREIHKGERN